MRKNGLLHSLHLRASELTDLSEATALSPEMKRKCEQADKARCKAMSKTKAKTYNSEAMAAVHEMMEGLSEAGSIGKRTVREFDDACLVPAPLT